MQSHPDALVLVTRDFNYRSNGFSAKFIQRSTGLFQIVDVHTRDNVTFDWCLTNCNNLFKSVQLPPLGSSDHHMILMKSHIPDNVKSDNSRMRKRDLRESSLRPVGRWLTSFDWSDIYLTNMCDVKYEKFNSVLSEMNNLLIPLKKTKVTKSDKPWMTPAIKMLIIKRQKALHEHGKNSESYKL